MKKITFLLAALVISFSTFAVGMSGTYKVGVTDPVSDFTTLKAAVDAINTNGVAGDVLLEITSDLNEAANISLGVDMSTFKLTIKPASGLSPVITFSDGTTSASIDGHFVIGSPNALNTNLISTNNIIIDGSNTVDGITKNLTINGPVTTAQRSVFRIYGNNDNITIKNCIIICKSTSGNTTAPINITNYNASSTNYTPDNITIINNTLTGGLANGGSGVTLSNSGTPTTLMTVVKVQNNIISARATRAILFNYVGDGEISGNTITHDCQLSTGAAQTIAVMSGGSASGTFNIFNNKITQVKTWNTAAGPSASNGAIAIDNQLASPKIVNIYNNFITGFTIATATVKGVKIYGIRHIGGSTSNIFHNTIVIPEMTDMTDVSGSYIAAIAFVTGAATEAAPSGIINIKNNIVVSNESTMKVWGIRRVGTGGTFSSNNNVIYAASSNNYTGFFSATDAATLTDWRTLSNQDANSKSLNVLFTNTATGDLSLTGASVGDWQLAVPKQATVLTDINGDTRADLTYAGADEAATALTTVAKQFTVTAPNGTAKVYIAGDFTAKSWDITDPFELISTGTANQFSGIYPCIDGMNYKYLCEKGDWDYQAAIYNGASDPLTAPNRTYNAADVVDIWYRVKTLKLNVSLAAGSPVPTTLFVKGGWDAWAAPIELTKSGSTFSTTISGVLGDKIPANTQYKYYTNDMNSDNWESNADGSSKDNRWSVAPIMNDEIARFTTQIITGLDKIETNVRIIRTLSGIEVNVDNESTIELYTINGVMIEKTIVNGSYSRDLNNGIYIICVNGISTKFIK